MNCFARSYDNVEKSIFVFFLVLASTGTVAGVEGLTFSNYGKRDLETFDFLVTGEGPTMKTFLHRRPTQSGKHYQPSHSEADNAVSLIDKPRAFPAISSGAAAIGALAIGALSIGALAIGAVAIGRLVIGRLFIKKAKIGMLEVGELKVGKLEVAESAGSGVASREGECE